MCVLYLTIYCLCVIVLKQQRLWNLKSKPHSDCRQNRNKKKNTTYKNKMALVRSATEWSEVFVLFLFSKHIKRTGLNLLLQKRNFTYWYWFQEQGTELDICEFLLRTTRKWTNITVPGYVGPFSSQVMLISQSNPSIQTFESLCLWVTQRGGKRGGNYQGVFKQTKVDLKKKILHYRYLFWQNK